MTTQLQLINIIIIIIIKFYMNSYLWAKNCKYGDDAKLRGHNLTILCQKDLYLVNSTKKDDDNNTQHIYNFRQ
jgi:hypothetical protein